MKPLSIKLLLLLSFAFWASGFAKFVHEATEHHGRDASLVEDDEDDIAGSILAAPQSPTDHQTPAKPAKAPCPVCQMLAGMAVCHSTAAFVLTGIGPVVGTVTPPVCADPTVCLCFSKSARDPPLLTAQV